MKLPAVMLICQTGSNLATSLSGSGLPLSVLPVFGLNMIHVGQNLLL